ncbi:DUF4169 family protein [Aliiroseovarius sp. 2305UL8-7]|uniref:DUF4169 family protein n=1 Tax=Aliiroseovarius conchicola TaxID=3121637 RepID=UPI003527518F
MGDLVSLSKHRKAQARLKKRAQADENTVKFGRTLAERKLENSRAEKLARDHDRHEMTTDRPDDPS